MSICRRNVFQSASTSTLSIQAHTLYQLKRNAQSRCERVPAPFSPYHSHSLQTAFGIRLYISVTREKTESRSKQHGVLVRIKAANGPYVMELQQLTTMAFLTQLH